MSADRPAHEKRLLRTGVIGTGSLGRHHVRLLAQIDGSELIGIYDPDQEVARQLAAEHDTRVFPDAKSLGAEIEAAVVAVPTVAHCDVAGDLLESGVHVMVEKPITSTLKEADALLKASAGLVLAVGHVEFYNPAVQALLREAQVPRFVDIDRLSVFSPRSLDIDVVLDLMIHDLQIVQALDPSEIKEIRATGIDVLSPKIDIADARIELESGCVINVTASRVSSEKVRRLRAFMHNRYYSLDYQEQSLRGAILDDAGDDGVRSIRPYAVEVETQEPLRVELNHFLAACRGEVVPLVDGLMGRRALATALAVVDSIG